MDEKINWLDLAKQALLIKNNSHVDKLAEIILSISKIDLTKDEISSKLATALATTVKNNSKVFDRVYQTDTKGNKSYKRGYYRIKKTVDKQKTEQNVKKVEQQKEDESPTTTQFIGKGGEFAVLSELLFRGFNASIMTVDDGIDIVASKNNKYFHIQVKTSIQKNKTDALTYTIKNSSFKSAYGYSTFYIFVFRREYKGYGYKNDFIILPNNMIDHYKAENVIKSTSAVSIRISVDEKGDFYLNKMAKIKQYLNNFDQMN
jgi:hypothetical protein